MSATFNTQLIEIFKRHVRNRIALLRSALVLLVLAVLTACGGSPKVTLGYMLLKYQEERAVEISVPAVYIQPVSGTALEFSNIVYTERGRLTGYKLKITPPSGTATEIVFSDLVYESNTQMREQIVAYQATVNGAKVTAPAWAEFQPKLAPADKSLDGMGGFGVSYYSRTSEPLMDISLPCEGSSTKEQTFAKNMYRDMPQKITITCAGNKVTYSFEFSQYTFPENWQETHLDDLEGFIITYTESEMK